ncbi:MAG: hypothetical protein EA409_02955 [Saprospirales bacterium]|nr:MAG: hypothetical protein EA409_02955 [Saprospirales bacterium]
MSGLEDWWVSLGTSSQVFFAIGAIASVFFVLLFIVSLLGLDADTDIDGDIGTDFGEAADFSVLSIRGVVAFFTFFGWGGFMILNSGGSLILALGFSLFSGFAALFVVGYLLYVFNNLSESGNIDIRKALYQEAEVYLPVGDESSPGRVHVIIAGRLRELEAISANNSRIGTGSLVSVIGIKEDGKLLVEPIQQLDEPDS